MSAFNLKYKYEDKLYPVECLFQGSKKFEGGEVYQDLYYVEPEAAKKDERLKNSGRIVSFKLFDIEFQSEPKDFFIIGYISMHWLKIKKSLQKY